MNLTAENVSTIVKYCLFDEGEPVDGYKQGEGVRLKMGFHPGRLQEKKDDILSMCRQLPGTFSEGDSFLNACITGNGDQWGEHRNIDELLVIGTASGCIEYMMEREFWPALPGGMPIFKVK